MKIIIPMAGMGKRMRPHTLTTPKPLIRLAGKSIVEHLIDRISQAVEEPVDEIAFITGHFGQKTEHDLRQAAQNIGAKASIYYQEEALGTAHAILCAAPSLQGSLTVAFADTLFYSSGKLDTTQDSVIWTKHVEDPSAFGVVTTDASSRITGFVEKPKTPVSNLAIIGIYFFKDGENLRNELQFLIDNNVRKGNEYQLTDALQNMMEKGLHFYSAPVDEWLDCGNKQATVQTHARVLEHQGNYVDKGAEVRQSVIVPPCYIAPGAHIENSVVGPYVTVDAGSRIENAVVADSIIQKDARICDTVLRHSMIGNEACVTTAARNLNLGDFSGMEA
ncbi:MAG: sugar phosphate nucleotidyltransferase [Bacteroides sp.]|nr:sugar phosphate nucleotidyltransferase [Bacteroides sp.]MCM1531052.1 sugar phosphate nucleotidyltransferase [Ruminococcus flavefaciens]MCM1554955.1 sugar phosphate nucleotidyltransferase [Bacteroides sp.]